MASKSSLPTKKLQKQFGYMLNKVGDYLSKEEYLKIALAEGLNLPESMLNPDSDNFQVMVLHTLHLRGSLKALNPEGLIEILKKINRIDAIYEVNQYKAEPRFKNERERYKQEKKLLKKKGKQEDAPQVLKDVEKIKKLLVIARAKAIIHSLSETLETLESDFEQYKDGYVSLVGVNESCKKFSETLERSSYIFQRSLDRVSESSLASTSSEESTQGKYNARTS